MIYNDFDLKSAKFEQSFQLFALEATRVVALGKIHLFIISSGDKLTNESLSATNRLEDIIAKILVWNEEVDDYEDNLIFTNRSC